MNRLRRPCRTTDWCIEIDGSIVCQNCENVLATKKEQRALRSSHAIINLASGRHKPYIKPRGKKEPLYRVRHSRKYPCPFSAAVSFKPHSRLHPAVS